MALRVMNWTLWLCTLALILIFVTSCNEVKLAVITDIESPLRNTCQSGDLDPTFAKCQDEGSQTFTGAVPSTPSPCYELGGCTAHFAHRQFRCEHRGRSDRKK